MENFYDDSMMPENFEEIAKAYSKTLKDKGFVFVNLQEEEFEMLLNEIFVILAKMRACLVRLKKKIDSNEFLKKIECAENMLFNKFGKKKPHIFECVEKENSAFLILVALSCTLSIKLMLLSVKSGEIELCNQINVSVMSVFSNSLSCEGFVLKN